MLKPDIFLKNRLLNKDYHHNECLKELQQQKIIRSVNSPPAFDELKKPTEKFDHFMRKTFTRVTTRELKTPKSSIKPISLNSVTQNSNFLDIRRGSLFNPTNNKDKDIISSQNSKKQLRFSHNNISSSEDEIQLNKIKRDLTFSSHLQELRNLKEDQKLDRKINKINELQREKNRKLSKRMSILKFITALKSSKNNFHINPIVSPNNLSNMDIKRYFSLMADLNNMIEKLSKNIKILLDHAGGNKKLIAKSLKKQKGYNEVIGNLLLDPQKNELLPNLTKEELTKKIEKYIVGSRSVSLGFLDKINYFNNNLLSYVIEKDKEWFEQKTNEIKNGLENWKKIKENYLEKVASKSQVLFFSKKKVIEEASNYFQPQNSLMNKIIWENLEKNERNLGQLTQVGKFNRAQWMNIQNLEAVFD